MSEAESTAPAPVPAPEAPDSKEDTIPKLPPRMDRPDRDKFERKKSALESEITKKKEVREKLWTSINDAEAGGGDVREKRTGLIAQMKELTAGARVLRKQKDELFNKRNALFDLQKKQRDELRAMRDGLDRFKSVEDINNAIRQMEYEQSTSAMSLNEEKAMMAKLKEMQKMKVVVAEYDAKNQALKAKDGSSDDIKAQCSAKQEEVNTLSKKIGGVKAELDKLDVVRDSKRGKVQPLRDQHEKVKKEIDDQYTELKAMRAKWKKDNDKFFDHMNVVKKIKAEIRKAEDEIYNKEREEERLRREQEEESMKPWLAEMALCDNLITYLMGCKPSSDGTGSTESKAPVTKSMKKSKDDDDLFGAVKSKKKKRRKKGKSANTKINHDFNTLNSFAQLAKHSKMKLSTPSTVSDVDQTVTALQAIKVYYDTRPREKKKKKKKEDVESKTSSAPKAEKGSSLKTPYGEATVEKTRSDGVVVAKLPWGQIFIQA
jgi:uncharacterized coiled-coil DUF342 family protein